MNPFADIKPVNWLKLLLMGLLLLGIYYSTFNWLFTKDWPREDFSYGYLIPFVVLYLIWEKRADLQKKPSVSSWNGLALLVPGIFLFWLSELGGEFFSLYLSFWFIVVSLCWINLGWEKLKTISFALVIALTMFPPPHFIADKLSLKLKLISSQLGVAMIQLYGQSAYRQGNIIDLGFTRLQVVDACSGLRYLFPLLVLGLLLAHFYKAAFWKKAVLVISTIPLTIFTNSLRIAITAILSEVVSPKVAEGFFHGFSGWFIFMFALTVLLLEMWALSGFRSLRKIRSLADRKEKLAAPVESSKAQSSKLKAESNTSSAELDQIERNLEPLTVSHEPVVKKGWKAFFHPPQFLVALILLGVTLVLSQGIEFREKIPISRSFDQFPLKVGEWSGTRHSLAQIFLDELDLSDYIVVQYQNREGKTVNLYTAYYQTQRKGESIHSPATCLPGSGWEFNRSGAALVPMPGHGDGFMPVSRAFLGKSGNWQLSYYWFPQRGRILTNAYQLKLYNFWDALTRQRTDGALVRLITPVYENEKVADAEKRLQSFMGDILPVLDEFLPD
jgi:EpsI family protein